MLPLQHRIRRKKDFENIFKKGQVIVGRFFIIKVINNKEEKESRFAFIFPAKLEKSACKRNKVKRILREIIRNNITEIKEGIDVVFILRKEIKNKNYLEIKEEINNILKENKLFK